MVAKRREAAIVIALGASLVFCHAGARSVPPAVAGPAVVTPDAAPPEAARASDAGAPEPIVPIDERWTAVDAIVQAGLDAGKMPGCVVVVGRHDEVLFEKAYGSRSLVPDPSAMTLDTVFDLASLTKPVATATSVMILADRGKIDLDARASQYVPELARLPPFTVRQLLVHTSGLPAGAPASMFSPNRAEVMRHLGTLTLKVQPGERFTYSDVGYVVLQEIVQRVSGHSLATFALNEIFGPLGMSETGFLPGADLRSRAAPTEVRDGGIMQGEVHDPTAFALGGVGGNAGVFSTAQDMSRYARAMLQHGFLDGTRLFSDKTWERFTARQETSKGGRTLGWDIDSTYATHRGALLSPHAFGHGGYTGTALWIDPDKDLFVLFLSNRVHPDGRGVVNPLIGELATAAVDATVVRTGIDVVRAEGFARLHGARVGLVTNASARARDGTPTVDVLRTAPPGAALSVAAIFTPEHGLFGDREGNIADSSYEGIPVHSLYGEHFSPTASSLAGIDTLVFDLQDAGVRFYTYGSTMKRAMKVAAERHLRFVVLDRPDPLGGDEVEGPVLEASAESPKGFVNYHPLPLRHGMTMGELSRLFADDDGLELSPDVVPMVGWRRKDAFDRTGLVWAAPSPNLRTTRSVALYPAIGLLESTNVSVGRGTDTPFEIVAAPWMDGAAVAKRLAELAPAGVAFEPTEVTPRSSVHANKKCHGIKLRIVDPASFEPIRTAITIAIALRDVHPNDWDFDGMNNMLRSKPAMAAIRGGKGLADIEATWASGLAAFKERRQRFLLYR